MTVTRILIDNATLSGVERISGVSQTRNLSYADNDILCLEKLITAILFSDELIGIDDYKDAFRSSRLKNFSFIDFLKIDQNTYSALAEDAATFAKEMAFSFKGSKPSGDVLRFFEALQIEPQLRWNVWVSSEYLTLSFLVHGSKYAPHEIAVDSMFRNENTDCELIATETDRRPALSVADRPDIAEVKDLINALRSGNPNYAGSELNGTLERLIFGYGWAAERSYFYNAVAQMNGIDAYLAPLRDAFCESCCRIDYPSQAYSLLDTLKRRSQDTLASILEPSGQAKFALKLPFFTAYMISRTENPTQCIELALSLRSATEFRECRTIIQNLGHLSGSDKVEEINGVLKYLDQSCNKLLKKYAISTDGGLQFSLSLGLSGLSFGIGTKLNHLFRSYKNEPFARVFRNIAQDMINVERLGGLYDKLCSSIREHPKASPQRVPTTPKFMEHKENQYSRPAEL